jgi:Protein of unknown function (DUF2891)
VSVVDDQTLPSLVQAAIEAAQREYPHKLDQQLDSDADLRPPRVLNPSFYGSYDWHSAVHNHWLLVRAIDRHLPADVTAAAVALLDKHLSDDRLDVERAFFAGPGGATSERPYGWAWLVLLHAECAAVDDPRHRRWAAALAPFAALLSGRLEAYFGGGLAFPIRTGTHGNTAFSLHITMEAARRAGDTRLAHALGASARRLFAADVDLPWGEDPAGDAFLTAPLVQAALLADVLDQAELVTWIDRSLPDAAIAAWDPPAFARDGSDPGTVHLEGLLVSRSWCLDAVARALPDGHGVGSAARSAALRHLELVVDLRPDDGFNRMHWLPTFLLYLDERLRRF